MNYDLRIVYHIQPMPTRTDGKNNYRNAEFTFPKRETISEVCMGGIVLVQEQFGYGHSLMPTVKMRKQSCVCLCSCHSLLHSVADRRELEDGILEVIPAACRGSRPVGKRTPLAIARASIGVVVVDYVADFALEFVHGRLLSCGCFVWFVFPSNLVAYAGVVLVRPVHIPRIEPGAFAGEEFADFVFYAPLASSTLRYIFTAGFSLL